jgi:hypothetical protein
MARRSPPRKVTNFEPIPPHLARNTIIESTFEVGRRFCARTIGDWLMATAIKPTQPIRAVQARQRLMRGERAGLAEQLELATCVSAFRLPVLAPSRIL